MALALALLPACWHGGANPRSLHYVGAALVTTRPADPRAYAYYLQCQLALAQEPPDLARAREQISLAIDVDPRDAHLWTMRGQVALAQGDAAQARRASDRALGLRPDYPPALALAARVARGANVVQR